MLADANLPHAGSVIDFGAGTGTFLSALGARRPDAALYAIEPFMPASSDARIRYVTGFEPFLASVDLVCAFEVCEHLTDDELEKFVTDARRAMKPHAKLIISVPVMWGAALLLKEINRCLLFRRSSNYTIGELIQGVFGGKVVRPAERRATHKGFDFRLLRSKLKAHFEMGQEFAMPLPLPWWGNSQMFFVCARTGTVESIVASESIFAEPHPALASS